MIGVESIRGSLVVFILLIGTQTLVEAVSYAQWRNLFSLAHSLTSRVASLRASRGDYVGAERAKRMAQKVERGLGLGFWKTMLSMGWDYLKNYAWRDISSADLFGAFHDANELLRSLNDLMSIDSDLDRVSWVRKNYENVLRISKSLFHRLLSVFSQSGILREVIEEMGEEMVEGGFLKDCLELGSKDLNGLVQVFKDLVWQQISRSQNSDL